MLVERKEAAGYAAPCLTVDAPILGRREPDVGNGFNLPAGMRLKNLDLVSREKMLASGEGSA